MFAGLFSSFAPSLNLADFYSLEVDQTGKVHRYLKLPDFPRIYNHVEAFDPRQLGVLPRQMQFKVGGDAQGVTGKLRVEDAQKNIYGQLSLLAKYWFLRTGVKICSLPMVTSGLEKCSNTSGLIRV